MKVLLRGKSSGTGNLLREGNFLLGEVWLLY
jgi:hypothetical protein